MVLFSINKQEYLRLCHTLAMPVNVAMYTNAKVDKILEDAFITVDDNARIKKYASFETEIKKDNEIDLLNKKIDNLNNSISNYWIEQVLP